MNITNVKVKLFNKDKTRAFATITIGEDFVVSGLKVLDGSNGLWVSMPNYKKKDNTYQDVAYPVTKEAREEIQTAVLTKYHEVNEGKESHPQSQPQREAEQVYDQYEEKKRYNQIDVTEDDLPF